MEVKVTVEKSSDGTYAAFMEDVLPDFGLAGYGQSAKEAIDDFFCSVEETKEFLRNNGKEFPDINFSFYYDLQSFFSYFSYLNISKIGEKSGISPSLMRQYVAGSAKASQKQYDKIRHTISEIVNELSVASI
ncbi:MAG: pilus assembly protein HicB [Muribaculaceae bacterium]|nr:pilus assembly protein HicB [Muribaculaceae bacterium]